MASFHQWPKGLHSSQAQNLVPVARRHPDASLFKSGIRVFIGNSSHLAVTGQDETNNTRLQADRLALFGDQHLGLGAYHLRLKTLGIRQQHAEGRVMAGDGGGDIAQITLH